MEAAAVGAAADSMDSNAKAERKDYNKMRRAELVQTLRQVQ